MRQHLFALSQAAFAAHRHAQQVCSPVVTPASRPIAWFGDTRAYDASPVRIMSTGLNPSQVEFPTGEPDRRFPAACGVTEAGPAYSDSLNRYFTTEPYWRWFNTYRPLLEGLEASFDGGHGPNTAVHTDLCSPVPTSPTWSKLPHTTRTLLAEPGRRLWHDLVRVLQPDVVLLSVARHHLDTIDFAPIEPEWTVLHTIEQKKQPYLVRARRYDTGGRPVLVVWGRAANTPFGSISYVARREIGARILKEIA